MKSRPPVEKVSIYALLVLLGFFVADFGLLFLRSNMYPQPPPPAAPQPRPFQNLSQNSNFGVIRDRDIFNADGKIPQALGEKGDQKNGGQIIEDPEPVPSNLPIQLLGTIVHANPARSIATVGLKTKNDVVSVKPGDIIPDNLATVILVERSKLTFRNRQTNHREYVQLKDDIKVSFGAASAKPVSTGPGHSAVAVTPVGRSSPRSA